jgi:hypothetical protein
MNTASKRRPALQYRPWLRSTVYDALTRPHVAHLDAWVTSREGLSAGERFNALVIEMRAAGRAPLMADAWLLGAAGGPRALWSRDAWSPGAAGVSVETWTRFNAPMMREAHGLVLNYAERFRALPAFAGWRVSVHAHYVRVSDARHEPGVR